MAKTFDIVLREGAAAMMTKRMLLAAGVAGSAVAALSTSATAQTAPTFSEIIRNPVAPFLGAADADVTVVSYVDYNCGYCKRMLPTMETLVETDPKVRVLYKDLPIFGPVSEQAARLALASSFQGKYETLHAAFMSAQGRIASEADIARILRATPQVDSERLTRDISAQGLAIEGALRRHRREAAGLRLQGTPALVINGLLIPGGLPLDELRNAVAHVRNRA